MRLQDIAVVGASGLVGRKIIEILIERNFPVGKIIAIASEQSVGKELNIRGNRYKLHRLEEGIFKNVEFAFFSAGAKVSHDWVHKAVSEGTLVIDNSSAFRMDDNVPLVVPEVNRNDIFKHKGIISNPNCSTIQLVLVLKPLDDLFKIKRVVVSTYQSVSGAGYKGITALEYELKNPDTRHEHSPFAYRIAHNAIPHIDIFFDDGYTKEELKIINESRKILNRKELDITATCVRIPSHTGHGESVNIEFDKSVSPADVSEVLRLSKGIRIMDDHTKNEYPMPLNCRDTNEVLVGRIRKDYSVRHGINLWIVADNIRKGAALNAVQISEEYIKGR